MFNKIKQFAMSLDSDKNIREWGRSITLRSDISDINLLVCNYREKFLILNPKSSIILETHSKYNEVWIADNEFDYLLEDENKQIVKHRSEKFERVFIPKGYKHKLINPNDVNLNIFEIQTGQIKDDDKIQYKEEDICLI